jgi:hypothetical protein
MVFELTGGHPRAVNVLLKELQDQVGEAEPAAWLQQNRGKVLHSVVEAIQRGVVRGLSAEARELFNLLALLREFDVNTLRTIIPPFLPTFRNRSQSALLLSIQELLYTRLVGWSETTRSYQIDPAVRFLFAQNVAYNQYERSQAVHTQAIDYYRDLVDKVPANRTVYLLEYCYHQLALDKPAPNDYSRIKHELAGLLKKHYTTRGDVALDKPAFNDLQERVKNDDEIQNLLRKRGFDDNFFDSIIYEALHPAAHET